MSFTISNGVYALQGEMMPMHSQGKLQNNLLNTSNLVTSVIDFALIATASIIGGLMLGGVLNFGLPMGVGTIGNYLAWGCVGLGGGLAIVDIITAIVIKKNKVTITDTDPKVTTIDSIRNQYHDIIVNTLEIKPSDEEIETDKAIACHPIIGKLYLGNSEAFAQTTAFRCTFPDMSGRPNPIDTSNPQKFETVITICPMIAISGDYFELGSKSPEEFTESFSQRNITWHNIGKMASDDPSYWEALVYDCTYLDTELGKKSIPKEGMIISEFEEILVEKSNAIRITQVHDWFEPIFKEIDQGVLNGKKVLVHCQAGQSRSATILAAYLINRFKVSSDQAIAFLKSKRLCVQPKFADQLNKYAEALYPAS